ncbi:MAG: 50S ribosomal protein L29 [Chloroflexia bacterium]
MPKGDLRDQILYPEAIRELNDAEILARIDKYREDLFRNRLDLVKRSLKNHQIMKVKRRNIARLETALREREIDALYAAELAGHEGLEG